MHVEAGHSAVPEEGPKDLRCPLCLYHTKYKRNMIDHIVLHRGNLPKCGFLGVEGCGWRFRDAPLEVTALPQSLAPHLLSRESQ